MLEIFYLNNTREINFEFGKAKITLGNLCAFCDYLPAKISQIKFFFTKTKNESICNSKSQHSEFLHPHMPEMSSRFLSHFCGEKYFPQWK